MLLFPLQQCKAETTCTIEAQYMFVILIKKIICQAEETAAGAKMPRKAMEPAGFEDRLWSNRGRWRAVQPWASYLTTLRLSCKAGRNQSSCQLILIKMGFAGSWE